ncbi:MAG: 1,2-phenylacetyl-CoA epoxidase subunit PaaE [Saprospiraceae bacterium]
MSRFHSLKVKEIRPETDSCVSIAFDVPENLKEAYAFEPGQHLTLKVDLDGEEVRRSYSICTAPEDNDLRVAVKWLEGGKFSTFANKSLAAGGEMDVMIPMGNFTVPINPSHQKQYVAFVAGSGITPVMAHMKTILRNEPQSSFTLFYGNRTSREVIFLEEIEALKNKYLGRLSVYYVLSQEHPGSDLFYGRINEEKCETYFDKIISLDETDEFFLCGPEELILEVKSILNKKGVDKKKVHFELFTTPGLQKGGGPVKKRSKERGYASAIEITIDTKTFKFEMESDEETILDAASKFGTDLPFACKGGVCCTCKAKVLEGEVEMDVNYALEQEEVEAGYVLTCQSHPVSKEVKLSFDE